MIPTQAMQGAFANSFFGYFVYQNPHVDFHTLDVTKAVADADAGVGKIINSTNPDLLSFERHGGKIIQYHGWADSALTPRNSINYYNEVRTLLNGRSGTDSDTQSFKEIQSFYRLFMVPGMAHCGLGAGSSGIDADHDIVKALDRWVEQGIAPDVCKGRDALRR
jgi:feruloyl esterase